MIGPLDGAASGTAAPPLRAITVAEQLAERLAADILHDRLAVGERLGEEAIAARFEVSRGPVRAALRILERRGLAKSSPRRGFFVAKLAPETFRDAIEIRFWLIVLGSRSCARSGDEEALLAIRQQLSRLRRDAADLAVSPADFAREISIFYQVIVAHSRNSKLPPILQETLDETAWALVWRHWCIDYTSIERREWAVRIFDRLVRAIAGRDQDGAEKQARQHLEDSLKVFLERLQAQAANEHRPPGVKSSSSAT
jgi:DNA-binding GntR family transcriptional regulator